MHEANLWELVDRLSILKLNEVVNTVLQYIINDASADFLIIMGKKDTQIF